MDVTDGVSVTHQPRPVAAAPGCPRCGEVDRSGPGVVVPRLGGGLLRRCGRCGTRFERGGTRDAIVYSCEGCGLPFAHPDILPHGEQRCASCEAGAAPPEFPDPDVARATENEIRAALGSRWSFVGHPRVDAYLLDVASRVAARIEAAPPVSVVVVDDPCVRTLALPSGTILLSTGALAMVEDEAELAFVLGHEIAHAASGEAAVRLTRLGFRSSVGMSGATDGSAWFEAASDLVRLGYGRLRERDADERAVEALLALGYDPEAALRHLRRLDGAIASGTPLVADAALAHPAPEDRIRRIERTLYGRVDLGTGSLKINREVFRRAMLSVRTDGPFVRRDLPPLSSPLEAARRAGGAPRRWIVVGAALLALVATAIAAAIIVF